MNFQDLQDSIVCLIDWYYAAQFARNLEAIKHLEDTFGMEEWKNKKDVFSFLPYKNPFSWEFQIEHRYNFFWIENKSDKGE